MSFDSFYKTTARRKFNTWCNYTQRLDTYGCGCVHECKYCYAKALLNFRGNWGRPKVAGLAQILKRVKRLDRTKVVKMGFMSDCFQPFEQTEKVTYNTIKMLNFYRIHYLIVTKNSLVSRDEYMKIYDKSLAHFQVSISSTSDTQSREYESASPTSERIKAIEKLNKEGFDVSVRLSPFLFQYVDYDILNGIECNKILIEFLKINHWIEKLFKLDFTEYSYKYGGHKNLNLERKIELVENIKGFKEVSVGEYVADHYRYFRENVNFNKQDCCNLSLNFKPVSKQLELYENTSGLHC